MHKLKKSINNIVLKIKKCELLSPSSTCTCRLIRLGFSFSFIFLGQTLDGLTWVDSTIVCASRMWTGVGGRGGKNRGIEEKGGRERETWRARGRVEEGRTKLGSRLACIVAGAGLGPRSASSPFPPPSFLPSLPPVSPAPRSPSAACACEPRQGHRSRSGPPRSSSPSQWRSRPSGLPPPTGSLGSHGAACTPQRRTSSRTPRAPRRSPPAAAPWRSWTAERWSPFPGLVGAKEGGGGGRKEEKVTGLF